MFGTKEALEVSCGTGLKFESSRKQIDKQTNKQQVYFFWMFFFFNQTVGSVIRSHTSEP